MEQKRRLKRRHLVYYLKAYDRDGGNLVGNLVDITPEGVMLISEAPVEADTVFQLQVELPSGVSDRERLDIEVRSLWCKPDVNAGLFAAGFELRNADPQTAEDIEHLIAFYGFND